MLNKIDKVLTHVENAITGSLFIASLLVLGWNIIMRKVFHNASTWAEEAIRYAITRRQALERFIIDGRIEIDSNTVERAIRPQTITKKIVYSPAAKE